MYLNVSDVLEKKKKHEEERHDSSGAPQFPPPPLQALALAAWHLKDEIRVPLAVRLCGGAS